MSKTPRRKMHVNRFEIRLSDMSAARLRRLQERTDAASCAEVVRVALAVYEDTLDDRVPDPWSILKKEDP